MSKGEVQMGSFRDVTKLLKAEKQADKSLNPWSLMRPGKLGKFVMVSSSMGGNGHSKIVMLRALNQVRELWKGLGKEIQPCEHWGHLVWPSLPSEIPCSWLDQG